MRWRVSEMNENYDIESSQSNRDVQQKLRSQATLPYPTRSRATVIVGLLVIIVTMSCAIGYDWCATTKTMITTIPREASAIESSKTIESSFAHLRNLVIVAGHAVYKAPSFALTTAMTEGAWFLEPYQQVDGQAASFIEMIERGVKTTATDAHALLLFSGGQTRNKAGPLGEGESYYRVAEAAGWMGHQGVRQRTATEDFAKDTYENIIFSICRFHELVGGYPEMITVISYDYKGDIIVNRHRHSIRFPRHRFSFQGTPPVGGGAEETEAHIEGREKGMALVTHQFSEDPYACIGPLREKKLKRNPYSRTPPYAATCPELNYLLHYCGNTVFSGPLPWDG